MSYIRPYAFGAGANIIPSYVSKCKDLSSHAKLCWGVMARCSNHQNYTFASVDYISEEAGLTKRTVERALAELEDYGLIETVRRRSGTALRYFVEHQIFKQFRSDTRDTPPQEPDPESDPEKMADRDPPQMAGPEPPREADREPPQMADQSLKQVIYSCSTDTPPTPSEPPETHKAENGTTKRPHPLGWETDETYRPLVELFQHAGADVIEEDFQAAWPSWMRLDAAGKLQRIHALDKAVKIQAFDHPRWIPGVQKWIDSEYKRKRFPGKSTPQEQKSPYVYAPLTPEERKRYSP